ncbi:ricin-type beta-trefoil lectin domain protein, partial [Streptomyces sp. NPDC006544]|uniref:ricin-type beta-trefoil lectin domain protein n=1 Tax=Streptomyces sp. NPDC006544 TaxID=3154583 RepID=UPI0033B8B9F4
SIKGTADAPDLTGFTDPAAGLITGKIDPALYPRVGSDGDLNGDKIPDLWAVDKDQQLVSFNGLGTAPNGTSVLYPTVTGIAPTFTLQGSLNTPTYQWKLNAGTATSTPSADGNKNPATTTGITYPAAETIEGRSTSYAAFNGAQATITAAGTSVDTRKSFTISTWAKAGPSGGLIASQDNTRNSAFTLYADAATSSWRFAMASSDADGWAYDWSGQVNDAGRFVPNAWTRLTAVYNAETGLMSLYVNGVLAASGNHAATTSPAPTGPLVLGRYKVNGQPDYFGTFVGGISNFAVYPYAAAPTATGSPTKISLASKGTKCADLASDGSKVQIWDCNEINGGLAQQFGVRADGTVRIQGKCLDAKDAGTGNGTLIQAVDCHNHPAQRFLPRADGSLHNPVSGRCLDLNRGDTTNGIQLQLWDCNQSDAQRWSVAALATATLPVPSYDAAA